MASERFILKPSQDDPLKWVVYDSQTRIVVTFREHEYNETVKMTPLEDLPLDPVKLARAAREISDWLAENHRDLLETNPLREIGKDIRAAMFDQGITPEVLAKLSDLSVNNVRAIMFGRYNYKINNLIAVCRTLSLELTAIEMNDNDDYYDQ